MLVNRFLPLSLHFVGVFILFFGLIPGRANSFPRSPEHFGSTSLNPGAVTLAEENLSRFGEQILHKVGGDDISAFFGFTPEFSLVESPVPNAYSVPPNRIIISTSLVPNLDHNSLAFVILHEISHLLSHEKRAQNENVNENKADQYAYQLMEKLGLNSASSVGLRKTLIGENINSNK